MATLLFGGRSALRTLDGNAVGGSHASTKLGRSNVPGSFGALFGATPSPVALVHQYTEYHESQPTPQADDTAEGDLGGDSGSEFDFGSGSPGGASTPGLATAVTPSDGAVVTSAAPSARRTPLTPSTLSDAVAALEEVCSENDDLRAQLTVLEDGYAASVAAAADEAATLLAQLEEARQESAAQLAYIAQLQAEAAQLRRQAQVPAPASATSAPASLGSYVDDALKVAAEARREAASARSALLVAQAHAEAVTQQRDEAQRAAAQHQAAVSVAQGRAAEAEALLHDALEVTEQLTGELDAVWSARASEQAEGQSGAPETPAAHATPESPTASSLQPQLAALRLENDALRRRLVDAEAALRQIRTAGAPVFDEQSGADSSASLTTAAVVAATERGHRYKALARELANRLKAVTVAHAAELQDVRHQLRAVYSTAAASADQPTPLGRDMSGVPASAVKM